MNAAKIVMHEVKGNPVTLSVEDFDKHVRSDLKAEIFFNDTEYANRLHIRALWLKEDQRQRGWGTPPPAGDRS